ncbi:IclR family transcriptional regulator [Aminobacter aganoensis]|uniref:DNA-binding IclR family transcriptional regulator n=1 Tax=Aminobacter aganoensis TaxID=83264 RepID=A0A7X0FE88_9HYPH|nr:IclR family transcriptional regulator [Aminobacter aganoensis]MBB6357818.1 DNA-binding IclR family transcriptional regulator [Aminobacter aganoensis]
MTDNGRKQPRQDLAPALTRGLKILDLIAEAGRSITMTEIAERLDIAKSSAHGLLATLISAGYLERLPNGSYRLGLRVVGLAHARIESADLPAEFYSIWDQHAQFHEEAAVLAVLDGPHVVYIACRNSPHALGITFRLGMRLPACCTATGKALLSTMSNEEVRDFYAEHDLANLTPASVPNVEQLLRQLDHIRKRGYSVDDGETRDHMWSAGAPILAWEGQRAEAAAAISFLRSDMSQAKADEAGDFIRRFAFALSESQKTPPTSGGLSWRQGG